MEPKQPYEKLMAMLQGASISRIIQVANRLGIFETVANESCTSSDLATRLKAHPEGLSRLCNALVALELLEKGPRGYRLSPGWWDYLVPEGRLSYKGYMDLYYDTWEEITGLEKTVRTGKPVRTAIKRIKKDARQLKNFINGMHGRAMTASGFICERFDLGGVRQMIDIGGGPGTYTLEWASRYPQLGGVIFDLPEVIPITRTYIKRYGLSERIKTRKGDFHKDPIGKGYDLALLANILQMYGEQADLKLLSKVHDALAPGGRVVINGFFTDDTGTGPREAALFAMFIATAMPEGNAHPVFRVCDWLKTVGFRETSTFEIEGVPRTVIVGMK
jgi:3-hydroxy-5-methyl-1-naphthoate 3-O-methyltransferase